jgi:hypothetical protein
LRRHTDLQVKVSYGAQDRPNPPARIDNWDE